MREPAATDCDFSDMVVASFLAASTATAILAAMIAATLFALGPERMVIWTIGPMMIAAPLVLFIGLIIGMPPALSGGFFLLWLERYQPLAGTRLAWALCGMLIGPVVPLGLAN